MMAGNGSAFLSNGRSANLNARRRSFFVLRRTLQCWTIENTASRYPYTASRVRFAWKAFHASRTFSSRLIRSPEAFFRVFGRERVIPIGMGARPLHSLPFGDI